MIICDYVNINKLYTIGTIEDNDGSNPVNQQGGENNIFDLNNPNINSKFGTPTVPFAQGIVVGGWSYDTFPGWSGIPGLVAYACEYPNTSASQYSSMTSIMTACSLSSTCTGVTYDMR